MDLAARCDLQDIHSFFWNEEKRIFVQSKGSDVLDASCLLMPLVLFISPNDPRWLSTLQAVGEQLRDDSLIYRYAQNEDLDGLHGAEGTFNICSFWYVECMARAGDLKKARFLFEKMLSYSNHLGLFSEETGPSGEHLGNFPQAFTHLALISAVTCLDRLLTARDIFSCRMRAESWWSSVEAVSKAYLNSPPLNLISKKRRSLCTERSLR